MSRIQSVILDKRYYPTVEKAKAKAIKMGFSADKVDVTANTMRIRQMNPGQFQDFRMKRLTPTVQAVIGIPKGKFKSVKGGCPCGGKEKKAK